MILGSSLVFWGVMTNRPVIGLFLALIVELSHWAKFRWEFNEQACGRAWQLTTVAVALSGVLIFLDGTYATALPNLFTWLPPLLLPMQFIQSYGMKNSLPLNTFSFLAQRRRQRNLRLGLTESIIFINFGNIYFAATMVASTLGSRSGSWLFLPGIIILTGWMLLAASRSRPLALVVALLVAGGLAVAGQKGLQSLDGLYGGAENQMEFDPNSATTLIGRPGTVQQSPDIVWRIRPVGKSAPPRLLRTAAYNHYQTGGKWINKPLLANEFSELDNRLVDDEAYYFLARDATEEEQFRATASSLPRFTLRGAAANETPLPVPGDAASLRDFELDGRERNALGTVRVYPKHSVIAGLVLWRSDSLSEDPPYAEEDLAVPFQEQETLQAIVQELNLAELPSLAEKLGVIQAWFSANYAYSRNLTIHRSFRDGGVPSPLTQFLNTVKSGHCEYFATAATLLLRQSGIHTRYTTGYAVMEQDAKRGEFVIRGTHGHAWARVWDESTGKWLDFDATPSDWVGTITQQQATLSQHFTDLLLRVREDFFLWRNRKNNRLAATAVMASIGLGVAGFVLRRLWRSRRRLEEKTARTVFAGPVSRTPLHALERQAGKHLGSRPPGQPFAAWLLRLRPLLADSRALDEAIELHQRLRFDPAPPQPSHHARLAELARQLESALHETR